VSSCVHLCRCGLLSELLSTGKHVQWDISTGHFITSIPTLRLRRLHALLPNGLLPPMSHLLPEQSWVSVAAGREGEYTTHREPVRLSLNARRRDDDTKHRVSIGTIFSQDLYPISRRSVMLPLAVVAHRAAVGRQRGLCTPD
jgi:hypothetical protein